MTVVEVPGGYGSAMTVDAGSLIKIVNPAGTQVVDFWAHQRADLSEHLAWANAGKCWKESTSGPEIPSLAIGTTRCSL